MNAPSTLFVETSPPSVVVGYNNEPIYAFTQFYVPTDAVRRKEVIHCLKANVKNPKVARVILLNEREYTSEEMGVSSDKIEQIVIDKRLTFDVFMKHMRPGYNVLMNADIFLDKSIDNVRKTALHEKKEVYAQLRYEYRGDIDDCVLFQDNRGPRSDSADTYILHSSQCPPLKAFRFPLGAVGCDNKFCYLMTILGYTVYNDPAFIRTYHYHAQETRNYTVRVLAPYMMVTPQGAQPLNPNPAYQINKSNDRLIQYLHECRSKGKIFVIPRIAGVENNIAVGVLMGHTISANILAVMKNNAGVNIVSPESAQAYSRRYLSAFDMCELYASWEPFGHYYRGISRSQDYITTRYAKPQIWSYGFDIFHYIHNPWTHALKGMRILLISPFGHMMTNTRAYGVDLFPECTFVTLCPPQTQGDEESRDWQDEFADFCKRIDAETFDVALCSCGGYGNLVCAHVYSTGRSAIYVGGVLQMYFGIYGKRWMDERRDILTMYMTSEWRRPDVRPKGFDKIEKGCYW